MPRKQQGKRIYKALLLITADWKIPANSRAPPKPEGPQSLRPAPFSTGTKIETQPNRVSFEFRYLSQRYPRCRKSPAKLKSNPSASNMAAFQENRGKEPAVPSANRIAGGNMLKGHGCKTIAPPRSSRPTPRTGRTSRPLTGTRLASPAPLAHSRTTSDQLASRALQRSHQQSRLEG